MSKLGSLPPHQRAPGTTREQPIASSLQAYKASPSTRVVREVGSHQSSPGVPLYYIILHASARTRRAQLSITATAVPRMPSQLPFSHALKMRDTVGFRISHRLPSLFSFCQFSTGYCPKYEAHVLSEEKESPAPLNRVGCVNPPAAPYRRMSPVDGHTFTLYGRDSRG